MSKTIFLLCLVFIKLFSRSSFLPEDCIHTIRYSLPRRVYLSWISILHSFQAAVVPEVKFPFKEVRESITPQKRRVHVRWHSSPGCQGARISHFDLEKEIVKEPITVAFEEEYLVIQVPRDNVLKWLAGLVRLYLLNARNTAEEEKAVLF